MGRREKIGRRKWDSNGRSGIIGNGDGVIVSKFLKGLMSFKK